MDKEEREKLILENQKLAYWMTYKIAKETNHFEQLEDLKCVAFIALIEAVDTYDESKGWKLSSWVTQKVKYKIIDHLRCEMQEDGGRGAPRGEWHASRVADCVLVDGETDTKYTEFVGGEELKYEELEDSMTDTVTLHNFSQWLMNRLSERDYDIYLAWVSGRKMKDVGKEFGISESRVCQIINPVYKFANEYGQTKEL